MDAILATLVYSYWKQSSCLTYHSTGGSLPRGRMKDSCVYANSAPDQQSICPYGPFVHPVAEHGHYRPQHLFKGSRKAFGRRRVAGKWQVSGIFDVVCISAMQYEKTPSNCTRHPFTYDKMLPHSPSFPMWLPKALCGLLLTILHRYFETMWPFISSKRYFFSRFS